MLLLLTKENIKVKSHIVRIDVNIIKAIRINKRMKLSFEKKNVN